MSVPGSVPGSVLGSGASKARGASAAAGAVSCGGGGGGAAAGAAALVWDAWILRVGGSAPPSLEESSKGAGAGAAGRDGAKTKGGAPARSVAGASALVGARAGRGGGAGRVAFGVVSAPSAESPAGDCSRASTDASAPCS